MERLRRALDLRGRATRLEYWRFQRLLVLIGGVDVLLTMLAIQAIGRVGGVLLGPMLVALAVAVATAIRRLHDRGRSGWWLLVFWFGPGVMVDLLEVIHAPTGGMGLLTLVISLAGLALMVWGWIEIGFLRGADGPNRYGENPYAAPPEAVLA